MPATWELRSELWVLCRVDRAVSAYALRPTRRLERSARRPRRASLRGNARRMGSPRCLSRQPTRAVPSARSSEVDDRLGRGECHGNHVRYVREWLEQRAASGILEVEDAAAASDERRYSLSPGRRGAARRVQSHYIAAIGRLVVACTRPVDALMDAFRSGADALGPTPCVATPKADLESFEVLPIENDFYRFYR